MITPRTARLLAALSVCALAAGGCRERKAATVAPPPAQPAAPQPLPPRTIPILCMHDVGAAAKNDYSIKTAGLQQYLKWLAEQGYKTVTVRDVAAFLNREGQLPEKPVVLSFDDNWKSAIKVAKPLFDQYGFVGVVFVMSGNVGTGARKLTWEDCQALAAAGWEVGSHTKTHENLTRLAPGKKPESLHSMVVDQIRGSKADIEAKTGLQVTTLALPYGNYDTFVLETARQAGYTAVVSIDQGVADEKSDPFLLPRRMIVNRTSFATVQRACTGKTLHLTELQPPPGTRVTSAAQTLTAVLADADVTAAPLCEVQGKRAAVKLDPAGRRLTIQATLGRGANAVALSASGRQVSWLLIRD